MSAGVATAQRRDPPSREVESAPRPELLFRSGGGLHVPLERGPDGAIYVTSRHGYLDVLEPDGRLRFSVTLGGVASGPLYVDERGSAFVATLAGTVLGFDANGRKRFHYRPPVDVERGLAFGAGVGLLIYGRSRVVLGINRVGVPVYRFEAPADLAVQPLGFFGFCVVATVDGKLYAGNRAVRRKPLEFATAITDLQTTRGGMLWVRAGSELVALSSKLNVVFHRPGIEQIYAFRSEDAAAVGDGFVVTQDGLVHLVQAEGENLGTLSIRDKTSKSPVAIIAGDGAGGFFATDHDGRLFRHPLSGPPTRIDLPERTVGARLDLPRNRLLVGTSEGGIYAVTWR